MPISDADTYRQGQVATRSPIQKLNGYDLRLASQARRLLTPTGSVSPSESEMWLGKKSIRIRAVTWQKKNTALRSVLLMLCSNPVTHPTILKNFAPLRAPGISLVLRSTSPHSLIFRSTRSFSVQKLLGDKILYKNQITNIIWTF